MVLKVKLKIVFYYINIFSTNIPSSLQFGLDDDSDGAIHINLLPMIETCNKEKKNQKLMKDESQRYVI